MDMKDILEKLRGMDKKQLSEAVKQAKAYAETPQGKELVEKIKNGEGGIDPSSKEDIKNQLGKNPEIAKLIFDLLKG